MIDKSKVINSYKVGVRKESFQLNKGEITKIKSMLIFLIIVIFYPFEVSIAQNYNPIINYNFNGTPQHGIKIKTNLPFQNFSQMPTIIIEGYNYGKRRTINVLIAWYIYNNEFYNTTASSSGGYAPEIKLANEQGKVVIFIEDTDYYVRFSVRGYEKGLNVGESHFQNWSIVDEPIAGNNQKIINYTNVFPGKVGIGTSNPDEKLTVNGKIHAEEVIVDLNVPAPDYVFEDSYELITIAELEKYIQENKHLPGIPSANEMDKTGISLGEMNMLLLKKIEELTLYILKEHQERKKIEVELNKLKSKKND